MASTNIQKTYADGGNHQIGTFSFWLKRTRQGADTEILYRMTSGSHYFQFIFEDTDAFIVREYLGSNNIYIKTNRLFRDTSAWYHIVVRFDTTQSTEADRVRIYVNGVQETSFDSATYPSQNANLYLGEQQTFNIGSTGSANYFDGLMSHFHYCDGYSYAPTEFGETDSTTGEWKINTSPSVSYGTVGFWILKDGNTVTDSSPNSNDHTVSSGTLTKTEDNPSNVFATINQLQIEGGSSPALTFSNGNTKVTRSGNWRGHMSTLGVNKGKWYWEVKQTGNVALGIGKFGGDVDSWNYLAGGQSWLGDKNDVWISYNNGSSQVKYTGASSGGNWHPVYADGQIVSIAFDADNGTIWQGIDGTWMNSATETEIENGTTTNAMYSSISIGNDFFGSIGAVENGNLEYNFGNGYFGTTAVSSAGTNASGLGIFEYDVPAGYTALCTKGLNE